MRGKDTGCFIHHEKHRITPAYAGKRPLCTSWRRLPKDHPRVCGEKRAEFVFSSALVGSPPRMRGKVSLDHLMEQELGITPACAGKRHRHFLHRWSGWDHPRVCGEKPNVALNGFFVTGSPPRMRGKGLLLLVGSAARGITPAYAGKSVQCYCPPC